MASEPTSLVLVAVATAAGAIAATGLALGLGAEATAGAYAGGLTNTPALAASLEALKGIEPEASFDAASGRVLVGYSLGYPLGVTIALLAVFAIVTAPRRRRIAPGRGARDRRPDGPRRAPGLGTLGEVQARSGDAVAFGRVKRGELQFVADDDVELRPGRPRHGRRPGGRRRAGRSPLLGRESTEHVELDRGDVDFRRIVVSNRAVAGLHDRRARPPGAARRRP